MVKPATVAACCCKTGSFLPHRGGRARLAFSQKLRCRYAVPESGSRKAAASRRIVEEELQRETLSIVGWRDVPTNEGVLGEIALSSLPRIEQIFVNAPAGWRPRDMERRLFIARRRIEKRLQDDKEFYVCSL